ncbi:hypothetical protein PR048_010593 [Dryococelus australis]|uniref:Uncharacterized protein n=1 Tax=Dryococelus australis TaxID=614101 RepID=A0ABQ9I4B6_9NEOP|nr:hypothetical protein PR048_010593 [Dryococelus australis]
MIRKEETKRPIGELAGRRKEVEIKRLRNPHSSAAGSPETRSRAGLDDAKLAGAVKTQSYELLPSGSPHRRISVAPPSRRLPLVRQLPLPAAENQNMSDNELWFCSLPHGSYNSGRHTENNAGERNRFRCEETMVQFWGPPPQESFTQHLFEFLSFILHNGLRILLDDSLSETHAQCDENTARRFGTSRLETMSHLMCKVASPLSLPRLWVSSADQRKTSTMQTAHSMSRSVSDLISDLKREMYSKHKTGTNKQLPVVNACWEGLKKCAHLTVNSLWVISSAECRSSVLSYGSAAPINHFDPPRGRTPSNPLRARDARKLLPEITGKQNNSGARNISASPPSPNVRVMEENKLVKLYFNKSSMWHGAAVTQWLEYLTLTKSNRARFLAGPLPNFRTCKNVLDEGAGRRVFSRIPYFPSTLAFRRYSFLISLHPHRRAKSLHSIPPYAQLSFAMSLTTLFIQIWVALDGEALRVDEAESEVGMEQLRNGRAGETGDARENPPASSIVGHDSHVEQPGSGSAGNRTQLIYVGAKTYRWRARGKAGEGEGGSAITKKVAVLCSSSGAVCWVPSLFLRYLPCRRAVLPTSAGRQPPQKMTARWLDCSPLDLASRVRFPCGVVPGFSHVVIVPYGATGRRVFSGVSRFSPPPHFRHSGAASIFISLHRPKRYCYNIRAALDIEVLVMRGEYGTPTEWKGGMYPRKPADQRQRPARFPRAKNHGSDPAGTRDRLA